MPSAQQSVLLFDADCVLCRRAVRWLIRRDPHARLRFVGMASPEGLAIRAALGHGANAPDSLIFVPDWSRRLEGPWHLRADGALQALALLEEKKWAIQTLRLLPPLWLNAGYRVVAALRRRREDARTVVPFAPAETARILGGAESPAPRP